MEAFLVNVISEFGDKTFIICAIMAMKYDKIAVFCGGAGTLTLTTMLACVFGNYMPHLISPIYTQFISALLFLFFGYKILYECYFAISDDSDSSEVENEVKSIGEKLDKSQKSKKQKISKYLIFSSTFAQVFLGEWGDRSQITTLTLAASHDAFSVFIGSTLGQSLCTLIAVYGGQYIAKKVSQRLLNGLGGALCVFFALDILYNVLKIY